MGTTRRPEWIFSDGLFIDEKKANKLAGILNNFINKNNYISIERIKREYCNIEYGEFADEKFWNIFKFDEIGAGLMKDDDMCFKAEPIEYEYGTVYLLIYDEKEQTNECN